MKNILAVILLAAALSCGAALAASLQPVVGPSVHVIKNNARQWSVDNDGNTSGAGTLYAGGTSRLVGLVTATATTATEALHADTATTASHLPNPFTPTGGYQHIIGDIESTGRIRLYGPAARIGIGLDDPASVTAALSLPADNSTTAGIILGARHVDGGRFRMYCDMHGFFATGYNGGFGTTDGSFDVFTEQLGSFRVYDSTSTLRASIDQGGNFWTYGAGTFTGPVVGSNMTGAAIPTATVGGSLTTGTATTFMRSNAAPALATSITPAGGTQTFNGNLTSTGTLTWGSSGNSFGNDNMNIWYDASAYIRHRKASRTLYFGVTDAGTAQRYPVRLVPSGSTGANVELCHPTYAVGTVGIGCDAESEAILKLPEATGAAYGTRYGTDTTGAVVYDDGLGFRINLKGGTMFLGGSGALETSGSLTVDQNLTVKGTSLTSAAATARDLVSSNSLTVLGNSLTSATATARDVVASNSLTIATISTPASGGAAGSTGKIAWDADYLYVCVAANSWRRSAITAW